MDRSVAVDHQARIGLGDQRRIEGGGEAARDRLDPEVVGDVALEMLGRETEVAEHARQPPPGMIAREHERRVALRPLDLNGRRLVGLDRLTSAHPSRGLGPRRSTMPMIAWPAKTQRCFQGGC